VTNALAKIDEAQFAVSLRKRTHQSCFIVLALDSVDVFAAGNLAELEFDSKRHAVVAVERESSSACWIEDMCEINRPSILPAALSHEFE
jgi:hypothetical protein